MPRLTKSSLQLNAPPCSKAYQHFVVYIHTKFSGVDGDREKTFFALQLTTIRTGKHTRLIHTLLKVFHTHYHEERNIHDKIVLRSKLEQKYRSAVLCSYSQTAA